MRWGELDELGRAGNNFPRAIVLELCKKSMLVRTSTECQAFSIFKAQPKEGGVGQVSRIVVCPVSKFVGFVCLCVLYRFV